MASRSLLLLFFFSSSIVGLGLGLGLGFQSEYSVIFPVRKDPATLQYVARVSHGTPFTPADLVVDLGAPFIWMDCDSGPASSSNRLIPSCSANCSRAKFYGLRSKAEAASTGCLPNTYCHVFPYNGLTGLTAKGELVEDILAVDSVDRFDQVARVATVDHFLFSCAPTFLLHGLASGAKGVLGFGKSSISLPSQLSSQKFSLCLSSSNGVVVTGNGDPVFGTKITRSLLYTPLIVTDQHDYFINVQSIKINGKRLAIDKSKLLKLSTNLPYTTMESSIYAVFSQAYANAMNMTRVAAVAPFDLCFSSSMLITTSVPEIELVLQSEMVKWRINGRNSMVKVSEEVMCLGVLDGGMGQSQSSPIVMGGLQLEDNLLEFDVGSSMLGFSSSLLLKETSCSSFLPQSKLNQLI